jgi:hypothetical protein
MITKNDPKPKCSVECNSPGPSGDCSCKTGIIIPLFTDPYDAMYTLTWSFPWKNVFFHLTKQEGISKNDAKLGIMGAKEFLALAMMTTEGPLAMTDLRADRAWHSAILHTDDYSDLMKAIRFITDAPDDFFIHHEPSSKTPVTPRMVERFNRLHARHFPHSRVWVH